MSNNRPVWQLVAGRSPVGDGTRAVFEWFEGLPSNLTFPPSPPTSRKNAPAGQTLPCLLATSSSSSLNPTPWQWPSGSSGMSSGNSPFPSGQRGLSGPEKGLGTMKSLVPPDSRGFARSTGLQPRESNLLEAPRPTERSWLVRLWGGDSSGFTGTQLRVARGPVDLCPIAGMKWLEEGPSLEPGPCFPSWGTLCRLSSSSSLQGQLGSVEDLTHSNSPTAYT